MPFRALGSFRPRHISGGQIPPAGIAPAFYGPVVPSVYIIPPLARFIYPPMACRRTPPADSPPKAALGGGCSHGFKERANGFVPS